MNLLNPGEDPHTNMMFLFFCSAIIKAVYEYQDLLRASIASAGNDHRLGANEAPPAIISIFLGDQLEDVFTQIKNGEIKSSKKGGLLGLGSPVLPPFPKDAGDRNRTSPFAFTGNKFEFRAVASNQSVSLPVTVLNTIVAEAIDSMCDMLDEELKTKDMETALKQVLTSVASESSPILFSGDGYSEEWEKEAEKRGLLNLRTTMDALPYLKNEKNVALFKKYKVLDEEELEARFEILVDQYFKGINIEGETTANMVQTMVIPGIVRYVNELAALLDRGSAHKLAIGGTQKVAMQLTEELDKLIEANAELIAQNEEEGGESELEKAEHMRANVIPAMNSVREVVDRLENLVADDYWPMPTYRDMLFIK
jgi:glutamine synthetase